MSTTTSIGSRLDELEARFKAVCLEKQGDNIPRQLNPGSPAPRRPKPFGLGEFPASRVSVNSPSPGSALPIGRSPGTPSRSIQTIDPVGSPCINPPRRSPASLSTPSPSPRSLAAPGEVFSPPVRTTPDGWNSTPSPGGNDPWRPSSADLRRSSGSASSPSSSDSGFSRFGSSNSLGGGLALNGTPRARQVMMNLPCSPQTPKPDSIEIEQKYNEIMKQNGILTINGERIETEFTELEKTGELGCGTCGQVVRMRHRKTGHVMAVKQMRRSSSCEDNKRIIMDLDVVLKSHNCPFIVQCIGTFIFADEVWICMELMATCLDKLMKQLKEPIPERILGKVTVATVSALHYLKENHGVIHRDVKPSNILLDERGRIKLCDFGISGRLVDSKAKTRSAGCAAYMAPERIDPPDPKRPDYDIRADVWSLGLSLVELATGEFPYKNCRTDFEMLTRILEADPPCLPSGRGFSMDFTSFVSKCLTKDYKLRPKYQQLLEHDFVKRYTSLNVNVSTWYVSVARKIEAASYAAPPSAES